MANFYENSNGPHRTPSIMSINNVVSTKYIQHKMVMYNVLLACNIKKALKRDSEKNFTIQVSFSFKYFLSQVKDAKCPQLTHT